jgi:hypothetical protein
VSTVGTVTVDRRFRGPTESGNGGYVCGRVAAFLGDPAEVTLRVPPPLGRAMTVEAAADGSVRLLDGETLVADGRSAALAVDVPAVVSPADAKDASSRNPVRESPELHIFPECFTCGPLREPGDGLRIIPGPVGDGAELAADTWTPHESLATADGMIPPEIVWAALDCTSYFGGTARRWAEDGKPAGYVLGRLAASVLRRPAAGELLVAMGWPLGEEGRKLFSSSAIVDPGGEVLGTARATWIRIG